MPTSVSIGGRSVSALPSAGFWRPKMNVEGGRSEVELDLLASVGAGGAAAAAGVSVLIFFAARAEGEGERERLALVVPLAGADPMSIEGGRNRVWRGRVDDGGQGKARRASQGPGAEGGGRGIWSRLATATDRAPGVRTRSSRRLSQEARGLVHEGRSGSL